MRFSNGKAVWDGILHGTDARVQGIMKGGSKKGGENVRRRDFSVSNKLCFYLSNAEENY